MKTFEQFDDYEIDDIFGKEEGFKEHDVVVLKTNAFYFSVPINSVGTIVYIHGMSKNGLIYYLVEFGGVREGTRVLTLSEKQISKR